MQEKGAAAVSELILYAGLFMVGFFMMYVVASYSVMPNFQIKKEVELVTAAGSISSALNMLSGMESGVVQMEFSTMERLEVSGRKVTVYIQDEKREAPLLYDVQSASVYSKKICLVKEPGKAAKVGKTC